MKRLIVAVMAIMAAGLWGYNVGSLTPQVVHNDIEGYSQGSCSDIVRYKDGSTVCEVDITSTNASDIKVFRKEL